MQEQFAISFFLTKSLIKINFILKGDVMAAEAFNRLRALEPPQYERLQRKAKSMLRSENLAGWEQREIEILQLIADKEAIEIRCSDLVNQVAKKLIQFQWPPLPSTPGPRKALSAPLSPIASAPSIALSNVSLSVVAAQNPLAQWCLTHPPLFKDLVRKTKQASELRLVSPNDPIVAQIMSAYCLLDTQAMTLKQAVDQTLSERVLSKVLIDPLTQGRKINPELQATDLLFCLIDTVMTHPDLVDAGPKSPPASPALSVSSLSSAYSASTPVAATPRTVFKKRKITPTTILYPSEYPDALVDPVQRKQILQTVLFWLFLVPKKSLPQYFKLIQHPESLLTSIVRFDLCLRHNIYPQRELALALFFSSSTQIKDICTLLSEVPLPPPTLLPTKLPDCFHASPYSDDAIKPYVQALVTFRFQNTKAFLDYPQEERDLIHAIVYASALQWHLGMPFVRALSYTIPKTIRIETVERLHKLISPERFTLSVELDGKEGAEIETLLAQTLFFTHPELFRIYMDHIQTILPTLEGVSSAIAFHLLAIESSYTNGGIPLFKALRQNLTPASLRRLFYSCNGIENITLLSAQLKSLAPSIPSHPCFASDEAFTQLLVKAKAMAPTDPNVYKVAKELEQVHLTKEQGLFSSYTAAAYLHFSDKPLRVLFVSADGHLQSRAICEGLFLACVDKILAS
jgi:hypothetical protein